jgi:hypothetical protein
VIISISVRATLVVLDIHITIVAAAVAGKCGGLAQGSDEDGSGSGDEGGGDEVVMREVVMREVVTREVVTREVVREVGGDVKEEMILVGRLCC